MDVRPHGAAHARPIWFNTFLPCVRRVRKEPEGKKFGLARFALTLARSVSERRQLPSLTLRAGDARYHHLARPPLAEQGQVMPANGNADLAVRARAHGIDAEL